MVSVYFGRGVESDMENQTDVYKQNAITLHKAIIPTVQK